MTGINLKPLGVEGSTGFSIKAKDTNHNQAIHDAFKCFAREECDADYTLALKRLLEHYETDWKYESLFDKMNDLEGRVALVEAAKLSKIEDEVTEEGKKAF